MMERIWKSKTVGVLLGMLLLCVHATAEDFSWQLPNDITMNKEAGRGGWLIIQVRLENGVELPFILDTGSPGCVIDKSFEPTLGNRLHRFPLGTMFGEQESGLYAPPKLFLGNVQLKTGRYIATYDFKKASSAFRKAGVMGILGMDCLANYCVQLDFTSRKVRFLDATKLNPSELGNVFPLEISGTSENKNLSNKFLSIRHNGLFGGTNANVIVDTGYNNDGAVENNAIKGHHLARIVHFFIPFRDLRIGKVQWDGEEYRKLRVGTGWNAIGLRFLARHLVTFDFLAKTMYLRKTSTDPLSIQPKSEKSNSYQNP